MSIYFVLARNGNKNYSKTLDGDHFFFFVTNVLIRFYIFWGKGVVTARMLQIKLEFAFAADLCCDSIRLFVFRFALFLAFVSFPAK